MAGQLAALGKFAEAMGAYDRAIALKPDYPEAYSGRAAICLRMGRVQEAIRDCSISIKLDPKQPAGYATLARAHFQNGNPEAAWQDLKRAQELGGTVDAEFLEALRKGSGRAD